MSRTIASQLRLPVDALFSCLLLSTLIARPVRAQGQPYPQQQQPYPQQQQQQYPPQQQYPAQQYPQQYPQQEPPRLAPQQLDQLVGRIALYPDPLLAQIFTAATYSNQIPDAATWAVQHSNLRGGSLAAAIQADQLPFDPSVMALLPFPSVLDMMARDMAWTQELGNAVLEQRPDLMGAVQHMRQEAMSYGYLQSNPYVRVVPAPGEIQIVPVNPELYYVPAYDPYVVYVRPRPGFYVGSAIRFGPAITIGGFFSPWGWGGAGFGWRERNIIIDHHPWARTWDNRRIYAHPYASPQPRYEGPRVERHEVYRGSERDHRDGRREDRREDRHEDHH